jgi:rhodanese-related sulfurtransferase
VHLSLGYLFRDQIDQVFDYGRRHVQVVLHLLAALLLLYIAYRAVRRWSIVAVAGVPRIDVDGLRRLLAAEPLPVVLDLRSQLLQDAQGRIPGAVSVELAQLQRSPPSLPYDRDIVTYCSCPNDVSAIGAARILRRHGYVRVMALRGGAAAWIATLSVTDAVQVAADPPQSGLSQG